MPITGNVIIAALFVLLLLVLAVLAIRIVPEYQRLVVFRLGRLIGERGPGLVLLIPFVDRGVRVDLRERFFDVQPQTTITEDNAHLSIDFLVYSKVVDAVPSVLNVVDHEGASRGIAITTLRAVVGSMLLDDVLAKREEINERLREKLDEVTNRWGIKVTAVEIREIKPPTEIEEAMTRQMSAERDRRAMVTAANGQREATIRIAEGDRQAAILRAEGAAQALLNVFQAARQVDSNTMALQYLDMLRTLGAAESAKFVIPAELMGLLRPFVDHNAAAVAK
ncbi:MAG: SPFH domain-containing protein [Gemmatimonadota bacterium]